MAKTLAMLLQRKMEIINQLENIVGKQSTPPIKTVLNFYMCDIQFNETCKSYTLKFLLFFRTTIFKVIYWHQTSRFGLMLLVIK